MLQSESVVRMPVLLSILALLSGCAGEPEGMEVEA